MNLKSFISPKHEKGQIIVIMALVFIGLVAIIGLAVDTGYLYVSYARLRRAVDAAALSATSQYKRNVSTSTLDKAAREFLVLNGSPADNVSAQVDTCPSTKADTTTWPSGNGDPSLCTSPARKLVRVTATENVPLFFLSVIGLRNAPITVVAVSEAAALDVVLVIDRSESMGILKPDGTQYPAKAEGKDPVACNSGHPSSAPDGNPSLWTGDCHPFQEVKAAAYNFVTTFMDTPYDQVAIVTFDNVGKAVLFPNPSNHYLDGDVSKVQHAIQGLWIYDGFFDTGGGQDLRVPSMDPTTYAASDHSPICAHRYPTVPTGEFTPCRLWETGTAQFYYIDFPGLYTNPTDGTGTGSTNIGSGLNWAAQIFSTEGRQEALWVTILLTDGVPNAGYDKNSDPICPFDQANPGNSVTDTRTRRNFCNDNVAANRHNTIFGGNDLTPNAYPAAYDTDDYARDMADLLAVNSLIFSIGLGDAVTSTTYSNPAVGLKLLNYIAEVGGTQTYYQANPDELQKIFLAIAGKIATRLTR